MDMALIDGSGNIGWVLLYLMPMPIFGKFDGVFECNILKIV